MNFEKYLEETNIIDFSNNDIKNLAFDLSKNCNSDEEIARNCFHYVRDKIAHSGDIKADITTCKASDVLKYKTGWCYAKSHLLSALLRANNIPVGFCYQRLSCGEYKEDIYCLHGLNAVYLKKYGWYRIDPRGNKQGVDAQFTPPVEKLAFILEKNEYDLAEIYTKPLDIVANSLQFQKSYEEMLNNLPLTNEFIRKSKLEDAQELSNLTEGLLSYIFEQTPSWFKEDISKNSFEKRLKDSNYEHYIYIIDKKIVGFITIKEKNHLYHLFVDKAFHKKGIAKKLFESVKTNIDVTNMKVNASLYSIAVYEALGFTKNSNQENYQGLDYQPMIYK